jgi:hypothetical protein
MDCDPARWKRAGSGRELQFFATDEEVQSCLESGLPPELGPWTVAAVDIVRSGRSFGRELFFCAPAEFSAAIAPPDRDRSSFWIVSERLSPMLLDVPADSFEDSANICGVPVLQHGVKFDGRHDASRLAIVDRVQHVDTGEARTHASYLRVFQSLCEALRALLVYSTVYTFPDGHAEKDDRNTLMSSGVAEGVRAGALYTRNPGHLLEP